MIIKKTDMKARVAQAAATAPDIADRIRHAQEMAADHPAVGPMEKGGSVRPDPVAAPTVEQFTGKHDDSTSRAGRHQLVPIDLIDQNPFNARRIYRVARINELAASIGAHGQETPGTGTARNGRYLLAAGHYRLRALKLLGSKYMELMVRDDLTDRDLYEISYRENAEREQQTAFDNALSWRQLLDDAVYASETDIAEATGLSLPNVNKTMAALRLSAEIREIVAEDPSQFPLSVLYELALYEPVGGSDATKAFARMVMDGLIGRKQIQDARAEKATERPRKRKETSRQYKMQLAGEAIGSLKEWDSGKVAFEIQVKDPNQRASIVEELRKRFCVVE
jgi:ParB family chromosome partitioning protein